MPQVLPSASPTVGEIITATGPDGSSIKVVAPGVLLLSADGSSIDATGLASIGAGEWLCEASTIAQQPAPGEGAELSDVIDALVAAGVFAAPEA